MDLKTIALYRARDQSWQPALDAPAGRTNFISVYPDIVITRPNVLDRLTALADPTRSRIMLLLDRHELTVGELCTVLQLPQSTVSRHLRILSDEEWIVAR